MSADRVRALDEQLRQMDRLALSCPPEKRRQLNHNREVVRRQRQALLAIARRNG
jgi:hypothetical protein